MTRLFIAEKPSVAKAIAAQLGNARRYDGFFDCDKGLVTWAIGHLLEAAAPDAYTPDDVPKNGKGNKIWRVDELPIIPTQWIKYPKKDTKKQLTVIGDLLKRSDVVEVVNAGDPDREGQLLVDQILEHFECSTRCVRFWVSAQDDISIQRGLKSMKPNSDFTGWADAARARSNADWLIGMNLSRAYTLAAERGGTRAMLVVGRVQTPTLNLVVERDRAIENFESIPFYNIEASLVHENGGFQAGWKSRKERDGVDNEGRILDKVVANEIVKSTVGKDGHVSLYNSVKKKQAAPIPFSLADLTMLASKVYGMTAQSVLNAAQSLYEKHRLTSYPRTDTGYLPESQHADAPKILDSLKMNVPALSSLIEKSDTGFVSRAFCTSKTTAHHGIIPTAQRCSLDVLNNDEIKLYEMIVRRYVAQFFPLHEFQETRVEATINGEVFVTGGKSTIKPGWRSVLTGGVEKQPVEFPAMIEGDDIRCKDANIKDAKTSPPKRYTEGTLIFAMENIHRLFQGSGDAKNALKGSDGIGTSATRASIITELKRRKYLVPKGKAIISTEHGRSVIDAYPDIVKSAHITAMNERTLKTIETTGDGFDLFMSDQEEFIRQHVAEVNSASVSVDHVPESNSKKKRSTKKRNFKKSASSNSESKHPCGSCGAGLVLRKSRAKGTSFWGCSAYPECRTTYRDKSGAPVY